MKCPSSKPLLALAAMTALTVMSPSKSEAQSAVTADQRAKIEKVMDTKKLSPEAQQKLMATLEARFNSQKLYEGEITFTSIKTALEKNPSLMLSLARMEETGGAPNLIKVTKNKFIFGDTSEQSPEGRRKLTYDQAKAMADEMGVQIMSPELYRRLQDKVQLDTETWSWLLTDAKTRQAGHANRGNRQVDGVGVIVFAYNADDLPFQRIGWRAELEVSR